MPNEKSSDVRTNNSNFQQYWWNCSMYVVHVKYNRGLQTFCWIMYEALFTVAVDDDSWIMVLSRLTVLKLSEIPFTQTEEMNWLIQNIKQICRIFTHVILE